MEALKILRKTMPPLKLQHGGYMPQPKIYLIITSFNEKTLKRAIKATFNQKTKYQYEVIVISPQVQDLKLAEDFRAIPFKDPGQGKSFALNLLFKKLKIIDQRFSTKDILILTDGDVYINNIAIEEIVNSFNDPKIGCVTGRPVPIEDKKTKYGYWANVLFNAAHNLRKEAFKNKGFIECSAYLFAFRGEVIKEIPLDVAEDAYIPYRFAEKGYQIGYIDKAEVYVKNVDNFKDWLLQKIRTSKAHETLDKYVDTKANKKVKSLSTEAKGLFKVLKEPRNIRELFWTFQLILARLYMWVKVKTDKKAYSDNWETVNSTK